MCLVASMPWAVELLSDKQEALIVMEMLIMTNEERS
jgi:hypothetical protein